MRCTLFVFLLFLSSFPLHAEKYFAFTPSARQAYEQATSLRIVEARFTLERLRIREPDNLIVHHIDNYLDFFTLFISEDKDLYKKMKDNRSERLQAVEAGNPASPYYLFVQADIHLQWALLRLRFGEYLGAFTEVSKAYRLLKRNQEQFPGFLPNQKDLAILHAMVGTIPESYRWGVKLLGGLDGTIRQGRREMELLLRRAEGEDFIFETESKVLYAFLLLHLAEDETAAWEAIKSAGLQPGRNPLHCFLLANIAMRTGHNERAVQLLQQKPEGRAFLPFPYLDFMLGLAKLRRLDPDAGPHFQRYLDGFQGQNFIKEAYQKLAWHALLQADRQGYERYMALCARRGSLVVDSDKSAQVEAENGPAPVASLLRARLLFDGAYYRQAYEVLAGKTEMDFPEGRPRLEYHYRMGRLLQGLQRYPQALRHYRLAIDDGTDQPWYFACSAALQSGLIYEELDRGRQATDYFQQCLDMRPDEYRTGLHQQAKSGLARLRVEQN